MLDQNYVAIRLAEAKRQLAQVSTDLMQLQSEYASGQHTFLTPMLKATVST